VIPSKGAIAVVCFDDGASRRPVGPVLKCLGLARGPDRRCRWHGPGMLSVHLDHPAGPAVMKRLRALPGVQRIAMIPLKRSLVFRRPGQPDSVVALPNGVRFGGGGLAVVAGPCSVESESQICEIAACAKEAGAVALRGGAFKPRTSPYSFGGLGVPGLEHLARAREMTGLPVVTEVLDTKDMDLVARYADVLQVGSRNMQNFPLLFKAGSHPSGRPVLLKCGFGATVEEFLQAAEYVLLGRLSAGRQDPGLILCMRGIRTFEPSLRYTLDIGALAVLRERTHLPVFADPSHASGDRRYVPPLARAAVAAGAQGLLIEVHPRPSRAWSDGGQCLDFRGFRELMEDLRRLAASGARRLPGALPRLADRSSGPGGRRTARALPRLADRSSGLGGRRTARAPRQGR